MLDPAEVVVPLGVFKHIPPHYYPSEVLKSSGVSRDALDISTRSPRTKIGIRALGANEGLGNGLILGATADVDTISKNFEQRKAARRRRRQELLAAKEPGQLKSDPGFQDVGQTERSGEVERALDALQSQLHALQMEYGELNAIQPPLPPFSAPRHHEFQTATKSALTQQQQVADGLIRELNEFLVSSEKNPGMQDPSRQQPIGENAPQQSQPAVGTNDLTPAINPLTEQRVEILSQLQSATNTQLAGVQQQLQMREEASVQVLRRMEWEEHLAKLRDEVKALAAAEKEADLANHTEELQKQITELKAAYETQQKRNLVSLEELTVARQSVLRAEMQREHLVQQQTLKDALRAVEDQQKRQQKLLEEQLRILQTRLEREEELKEERNKWEKERTEAIAEAAAKTSATLLAQQQLPIPPQPLIEAPPLASQTDPMMLISMLEDRDRRRRSVETQSQMQDDLMGALTEIRMEKERIEEERRRVASERQTLLIQRQQLPLVMESKEGYADCARTKKAAVKSNKGTSEAMLDAAEEIATQREAWERIWAERERLLKEKERRILEDQQAATVMATASNENTKKPTKGKGPPRERKEEYDSDEEGDEVAATSSSSATAEAAIAMQRKKRRQKTEKKDIGNGVAQPSSQPQWLVPVAPAQPPMMPYPADTNGFLVPPHPTGLMPPGLVPQPPLSTSLMLGHPASVAASLAYASIPAQHPLWLPPVLPPPPRRRPTSAASSEAVATASTVSINSLEDRLMQNEALERMLDDQQAKIIANVRQLCYPPNTATTSRRIQTDLPSEPPVSVRSPQLEPSSAPSRADLSVSDELRAAAAVQTAAAQQDFEKAVARVSELRKSQAAILDQLHALESNEKAKRHNTAKLSNQHRTDASGSAPTMRIPKPPPPKTNHVPNVQPTNAILPGFLIPATDSQAVLPITQFMGYAEYGNGGIDS